MRMGFLSIDLPNVGTVSNTEAYFGEIISGVKLIRSYKFFNIFTLFQLPVSNLINQTKYFKVA